MAKRSHLLSLSGLSALAASLSGRAPAGAIETPAAAPAAEAGAETPPPDDPVIQPSDTPLPEREDEDEGAAPAATGPVVSASDALRFAAQARTEERARMKTVLSSPEGKANVDTAAFLLCHSDATGAEIVTQLKSAPSAGTGAATQPRINLTRGEGAGTATVEGEGGSGEPGSDFNPWPTVQNKAGVLPAAANGAVAAAAAAGLTAPTLTK